MRIAVRVGAIALGVILILLVAAVLYLRQFDAAEYSAAINELVQEATGRELLIDGPMRLDGFPIPRIIAEQVRLANAPWGSRPEMLTAKRIELELSPLALLIGRFWVRRLVLETPEILLESDTDGRVNWDFLRTSEARPTATQRADDDPVHVTLSRVLVRNATLTLRDGPSAKVIELPVEALSLRETFAGDRLRIDVKASYKDRPVKVAGNFGRWLTLMRNEPLEFNLRLKAFGALANMIGAIDRPLDGTGLHMDVTLEAASTQEIDEVLGLDLPPAGPLTGRASISETGGIVRLEGLETKADVSGGTIRIGGTIADLLALDGVMLDVGVSADSLANIARLGGHELPAIGPVEASAKLHRNKKQERISELRGTLAGTDVSGSLAWGRGGPRVAISGELRFSRLDLNQFLADTEEPSDRLFSAAPVRFDALQHIDAQISVAAQQIAVRRFSFENLSVDIDLKDGHLRARPVGEFAQGPFNADLVVDSNSVPPTVSMRVDGRQISMSQVSERLRQVKMVEGGTVEVHADIASQGDSVRNLMANLNGAVRLSLADARVQNTILEQVSRDVVTEFLRFLKPPDEQQGMTELHCAVVHLPVRDGVVTVERSIAMETPDVNMSASGVIDLRDESLDLGVLLMRPKAIDLTKGSLADLARVQGTLLDPQVEADVTRTAVTVITGGVALLAKSVFDELTKDAEPCQTALAYQPEKRQKEGVASTPQTPGSQQRDKPQPRE